MKNSLLFIILLFSISAVSLTACKGSGEDTGNMETGFDGKPPGVTVSSISGPTSEVGTTATFTVKLISQPTDDVVIEIFSSDTSEGMLDLSSITFTAQNWDENQTVTITGVDDVLDDGDITYSIILSNASSSDTGYNGLNPEDVSVVNREKYRTIQITPTDDSWTNYSNPTTNRGFLSSIVMRKDYGYTWLKFDIPGSIGEGRVIQSAILKLYGTSGYHTRMTYTYKIQSVSDDTWSESTITHDTSPQIGAIVGTTRITLKPFTVQYYSWDITDYVETEYSNDGIVSLAASYWSQSTSESGYIVTYNSKEASENRPYLEIFYLETQ